MRAGKNDKEGKINFSLVVFFYMIYFNPLCIHNLKTLALTGAEKSVMKNLLGEKENGQIKGMISMNMLILSYTIQVIPNVCNKFQNSICSSC